MKQIVYILSSRADAAVCFCIHESNVADDNLKSQMQNELGYFQYD